MPRQQIKDVYEIVAEIGTGGMATVYKAIQKSLDRPVAIKELKKSYHTDEQIVRRFERESKVAASLQHENIVHIYDYWKKPTYCIVMEYVDGINLADVIEKAGALPIDVGVMIALQLCSALNYAHMRGLIHRDIKPSNIMIKRNGEVKLMDFGIAHTRNLDSLTMPGTLIGTPSYMSPEQILGQQLDVRSDIFSFGIVLYEMFTGSKPFADDETRAVSAKILKDKFLAPRRMNKGIPRSLQWIIKKCLRKKQQRRYESMLAVEKKLGKRLAGRTTKASSLRRVADYLVAMNVSDADANHDTMVVSGGPPNTGLLRRLLLVTIMIIIVVIGGLLYYYQTRINPAAGTTNQPEVPAVILPTMIPLVSKPQVTTAITPTAPGLGQEISSLPVITAAPPATSAPSKTADQSTVKSP
jgi:serine/threonine protein kinase